MSRTFNSNDVKQLIKEHRDFLGYMSETVELLQKYEIDTENISKMLIGQNILYNLIRDSVIYNRNFDNYAPAIENLIANIYKYKQIQPIANYCKQLLDLNQSKIKQEIDKLIPGKSNIRWFFTSSKKKDKAYESYKYLNELLENTYGLTVKNILEERKNIECKSYNEILRDFEKNSKDYKREFLNMVPQILNIHYTIQEFDELIYKHNFLLNKLSDTQNVIDKSKQEIADFANRLVIKEVLNILQSVPIEEINRNKGGYRIKALKDYGYNSMADIYTSEVYQLASVKGISEDTAFAIKNISNNYVKQAQKTTKIKLNADRKTKESTMLVSAIYQYRQKNKIINEIQRLNHNYYSKIVYAENELKNLGNGILWIFYSNEEKRQIINSYNYLNELINGNYALKLNELLSSLTEVSQLNFDDSWQDFENNSIAYFNILEDIVPGILGNDDSIYGLPEELARTIQDESFFPDGLLCTLRNYQEWGVKYILHQERVLFGDEMGLGKTIQAIATMVSLKNTGATHFIVVCPASVISNWCREINKQSKLRVTKVHGNGKLSAIKSWIKTGGVAVTTYETTGYFKLNDFNFDMIVVDEAHYVKNSKARRTINIKVLCEHTNRLLFMTGTALENNVEEMIALIEILQPEIASQIKNITYMAEAPQFREKIASVYYRRKREDVLTELPELIENKEWCSMSSIEQSIYEKAILSKDYAESRKVSWNLDIEDMKYSSKANRLKEIINEAEAENRKVIVFSFFLDTIRKISLILGDRCIGIINGSTNVQKRQEIIDEFGNAPSGSVLVAQIQSGGTGLNIQSASVVIICEPQFKPSIENQAISRAYRMGQSRNVLVYRLLCENTIDEQLTKRLEEKQTIFDAFADKSVAAENVEIDDKSFGKIIQEEIDRINAKYGNSKED